MSHMIWDVDAYVQMCRLSVPTLYSASLYQLSVPTYLLQQTNAYLMSARCRAESPVPVCCPQCVRGITALHRPYHKAPPWMQSSHHWCIHQPIALPLLALGMEHSNLPKWNQLYPPPSI